MSSGSANAIPLSVARLRSRFAQAMETGTLGGADVLDSLASLARRCVTELDGARRVLAYVLSRMLAALAYDRQERAVAASEDAPLWARAQSIIAQSLDALEDRTYAGDAVELASKLIVVEYEILGPPPP